jgi:hypothetical protein
LLPGKTMTPNFMVFGFREGGNFDFTRGGR